MASGTIGQQSENDTASASGSDSKKRNKLGYHRTAVACGHCRRRKIRCIPAAAASESRCQNCIRLKKECHFYPVDQNGVNTRKSRSDSKAEASSSEPVAMASSPSPQLSSNSVQGSFDATVTRPDSSATWARRPNYVTSPGQLSSSNGFDQQSWAAATQAQMNNQYSRHNSHPGFPIGAYWMSNDNTSAIAYQHQQFTQATTSTAHLQEPQTVYSSQGVSDSKYQTQRQSFNGLSNNDMSTSPGAYRHHSATFAEIERGMTTPLIYNHSSHHGDMDMQGSPSIGSGFGQYPFNTSISSQITSNHSGSTWFPHSSPSQPFTSPYLQSHVERQV